MQWWLTEEVNPAGAQSDQEGSRREEQSEGRNGRVMVMEMEEKSMDMEYILEVEPTGSADALNVKLRN